MNSRTTTPKVRTHPSRARALHPITMSVAVLCGGWSNAQAQALEEKVHQLSSIDVTAQGLDLAAVDMAAPVSVLEGQVWQQQRAATLGESLDGEAGIHATHFGAGASRPIIRGMDGPRIGVLANGMELHDASTISPDHAVVVEPLLVERVEILRGPAALAHGGAVGGVVNVIDKKIPTTRPEKGYEGAAELHWGSAANEKTGVLGLTTSAGPLVFRVEAADRNAKEYRIGRGWRSEEGDRKVPGSFSDSQIGSFGVSWVGDQGYLGAAYTRQHAEYGLSGHEHADCHLHGSYRIHCGSHGEHHHTHAEHESVPEVDMTSHRWDLRGEWRNPLAGVDALRLKGSHTRYGHDEKEGGAVATAFRNRANDVRLELLHAPLAGWRGMVGVSHGLRNFSANGEEQFVPATRTQKHSVFIVEEYKSSKWSLQAALRHDRQSVLMREGFNQRTHQGTSMSLGTVWKFSPGWQASASLSHAVRLPSAEELFSNGMHMATNTWEIGNSSLKKETNNALDLGVRKLNGDTTWSVHAYHYRINGYIYGRAVHEDEGVQLQHYTQANARFTGAEAQIRQRLNRYVGVSVFGDVVRARLAGGGNLPRMPAARLGLRVDASWSGWEAQAEWVQVMQQNRITAYEESTGGFGMLNMTASYRFAQSPVQLFIQAENLIDRLGYAHTSVISRSAPLKGRNITVGLRMDF
jgi:iron complex outermembrane receptor protein